MIVKFDQLTDDARKAFGWARQYAQREFSDRILCRHLLQGLSRNTETLAGKILAQFNIAPNNPCFNMINSKTRSKIPIGGILPFSRQLKRVIGIIFALAEVLPVPKRIGCAYLLQALLCDLETEELLNQMGVSVVEIKRAFLEA